VPVLFPEAMPWRLFLRFLAPGADVRETAITLAARPRPSLLAKVYATSVAGWLFTYTIMYCALRAVGGTVSLAYVFAVAPLSSIARFVPISAGGIGLGEFTMAAMLTQAGVPQVLAARSALLSMLVLVLLPGATGLLLLALHSARRRADSLSGPDGGAVMFGAAEADGTAPVEPISDPSSGRRD
jgi:uncharacterized membrane protein YbhN (UPF0104 family)